MTDVTLIKTYFDSPVPTDLSKTTKSEWNSNRMPRDTWQDLIVEAFESVGLASYGYPEQYAREALAPILLKDGTAGIETENFTVRSYYWGDDETLADLPNFVARNHDVEIIWYKYPLRYAFASRELTFDEFKEILNEFVQEVRKSAPAVCDLN